MLDRMAASGAVADPPALNATNTAATKRRIMCVAVGGRMGAAGGVSEATPTQNAHITLNETSKQIFVSTKME